MHFWGKERGARCFLSKVAVWFVTITADSLLAILNSPPLAVKLCTHTHTRTRNLFDTVTLTENEFWPLWWRTEEGEEGMEETQGPLTQRCVDNVQGKEGGSSFVTRRWWGSSEAKVAFVRMKYSFRSGYMAWTYQSLLDNSRIEITKFRTH